MKLAHEDGNEKKKRRKRKMLKTYNELEYEVWTIGRFERVNGQQTFYVEIMKIKWRRKRNGGKGGDRFNKIFRFERDLRLCKWKFKKVTECSAKTVGNRKGSGKESTERGRQKEVEAKWQMTRMKCVLTTRKTLQALLRLWRWMRDAKCKAREEKTKRKWQSVWSKWLIEGVRKKEESDDTL